MSPISTFSANDAEYKGAERRRNLRRDGSDRREMLRFELDNPNRRDGSDRRYENNVWNNLHRV